MADEKQAIGGDPENESSDPLEIHKRLKDDSDDGGASNVIDEAMGKWLKERKLTKLSSVLAENDMTSLEAFEDLETKDDVKELAADLGIKGALKIKFVKAVLELIADDDDDEKKEPAEPGNPHRQKFPKGINVVPFDKREYQLPALAKDQYASQGGLGYAALQTAVSIISTFKKVVTPAGAADKKATVNSNKRAPQKLFADKDHKIILVCGKTGAGKSTLINSMMNYIYDVQIGDDFRLKLIEEKKKTGGNADSCTDHISSYRIRKPRGGNINYDLTIIDTPGFGDVRGITKDMQILEEFKYIFNKILTNINGICFVVKSADNRLDAAQTYVFNNILNLWAKDVRDNIFILMTFADGKRANCIDALNKNDVLKLCQRRFKINNSAFTDDPGDKDLGSIAAFDRLFWDMGMGCFAKFFRSLEEVKAKSIEASKEVLKKRDNIQMKIHHVSVSLDSQLRRTQAIAKTQKFIQKHKADIDAGKEVIHETVEQKWVKHQAAANEWYTTCTRHPWPTCHMGCGVEDKTKCSCFWNTENRCDVCKCPPGDHINTTYYYTLDDVPVRTSNWETNKGLKAIHEKGVKEMGVADRKLQELRDELQRVEKRVENDLALVQHLRNELEKVALRPKLSTVGDYIDQLIANEEESHTRDEEKLALLQNLKKKEVVITKLQDSGKLNTADLSDLYK